MQIDQLPLNIQLRDDATLASFYGGDDNAEVLNAIQQIAEGEGEHFLYLWGQMGVGRSHLLQAACHAVTESGMSAIYVPLKGQFGQAIGTTFSPDILQGIEDLTLVCLDDIDAVSGASDWEEALFHLFNRIRHNNGRLLVSSTVSPKDLPIKLADLKSRLSWGVIYQLHRLNDEQKIHALQLHAEQRGIELTDSVGQFLVNRCARNMRELYLVLEKLDRASLVEQRRLTIPFVKQVLAL